MTQVPQGRRQVAQALARPQQRRLWVTARGRLYQLAQIIKQRDVPGREFLPTAASSTNPTRRRHPSPRNSARPRPIVLRAIPVMRDSADTPPHPADRASAAANRRRPRSSRTGSSAA
jgi:hypothetical protein